MVLDHLNVCNSQAQLLPTLDHLNAQNTLDGVLSSFLWDCKVEGLSPRTIEDYQLKIGAFVRHCSQLGVNTPAEITANHVRLFLLKLQERCCARSIKDYFCVVRRFFNWLVEQDIVGQNPMQSMRTPRVPKNLIKPFSEEHIKMLLLLCNDNTFLGIRNTAMILMFVDTGLRLTEMASVKLEDIDDRGVVRVMGKGGKERLAAMGRKTQRALIKYHNFRLVKEFDSPYLWVTEEGRPLRPRGIQMTFRRLRERADFKGVRCSAHTFRHTFATRALQNGAGEFTVQSLLGHSDLRMTRRYSASLNSVQAVEAHKRFSPVDNMKL